MMTFGSGTGDFVWFWLLVGLAIIGFVAGIALLLLRKPSVDPAATILADRLSRGEIDQAEYTKSLATLGSTATHPLLRFAGMLTSASLVALLALSGLTLAGALPRPGPGSVAPGAVDFVAGTATAPRVVRISAGPDLRFYPSIVSIKAGETITFEITTMGWTAHEFMVGPSDAVAADAEGTPEVADIGMMQSQALTYTFAGRGPFSFACHAPGHYEAGMRGTIEILP